jgi:hypothetical protein
MCRGLRQEDPLSPFLFLLEADGLNLMLTTVVDVSLFLGYKVGEASPVHVSHLQFVNDTLILGEKKWGNIRTLKETLILFELISGLRVNFHKSLLVVINLSDSWLVEASVDLNCKIGQLPFVYLGLPIGGN